jgi:hypothetical protein
MSPSKKKSRVGGSQIVYGRIAQVSVCPHGLVEGFTVNGAFVKLPPHHDRERALVTLKVGDPVTVIGEVIATVPNQVLDHITITRNNEVLFDHREIDKRAKPKSELRRKPLDVVGTVVAVATRKHGEIDRVLLTGNISVHLEKHAELKRSVAIGDVLHVEGDGTRFPRALFVRARHVAIE